MKIIFLYESNFQIRRTIDTRNEFLIETDELATLPQTHLPTDIITLLSRTIIYKTILIMHFEKLKSLMYTSDTENTVAENFIS